MALLKTHKQQPSETLPTFESCEEAIAYFEESGDNFDHQSYAAEQIATYKEGCTYLVKRLIDDPHITKEMAVNIASILAKIERKKAPIEAVMELLKARNAYIRNLGISILQDYGDAIKYYIVKFLIGDDRDLRIFAINVLGDVNFAESREMLLELLEHEKDINVAMTAVDYMAEIGEEEDIPLLESLKERFDDSYAHFAIDGAIRSIKG
ncbi:MAG: HEAT repeat domain-containing protein [Sulfurimonadaceae bacterium]|nr:HEAT repeat domain-containing protein [Sulfurimonadaceae bacterium]